MKNCSIAKDNPILRSKYLFPQLIWHSSKVLSSIFLRDTGFFVKSQIRTDNLWAFSFLSHLSSSSLSHITHNFFQLPKWSLRENWGPGLNERRNIMECNESPIVQCPESRLNWWYRGIYSPMKSWVRCSSALFPLICQENIWFRWGNYCRILPWYSCSGQVLLVPILQECGTTLIDYFLYIYKQKGWETSRHTPDHIPGSLRDQLYTAPDQTSSPRHKLSLKQIKSIATTSLLNPPGSQEYGIASSAFFFRV